MATYASTHRALRPEYDDKPGAASTFVWISNGLNDVVSAAFIGLAFLSNLLLMPVVFPLLAYATWHSYRHLAA